MGELNIDFIGIGTAKSASSTISKWLEEHPQICMSIPRKVIYFNSNHAFWREETKNWRADKPLSWYGQHFKHCEIDSIKGEFSAIYFSDPDAPKRIFDCFPDVKLIVCFRNPVDRAYSYYQMTKNYHKAEKRSFRQAIMEEKEYVERGLYFKYLQKYLAHFDLNQILILTFERVKNEPLESVQKLYQFLGADPTFIPESLHEKSNRAKKTKAIWMNRLEFYLVRTIAALGGVRIIKWMKKMKIDKWIHSLYMKPYKYPPISAENREWLKEYFLEDIEQLEKLIQKDLSHWK